MANYFVSPDGDNSTGATWATAKTTIAAGLALVTTADQQDNLYIAAGRYNETNIYPSQAGSSTNLKKIIGDPTGTVTDGGAATSGRTGYVMIDGSSTTTGLGVATATLSAGANWAGWCHEKLWVTGSAIAASIGQSSSSAGILNDKVTFTDCIYEGSHPSGGAGSFSFHGWKVTDSAGNSPVFTRCYFINNAFTTATTEPNIGYASNFYFFTDGHGSAPTEPNATFNRCYFYAPCSNVYVETGLGGGAGYKFRFEFNNCTFETGINTSTNGSALFFRNTSALNASVVTATDCLFINKVKETDAGSYVACTFTNCADYLYNAACSEDNVPLLPHYRLPHPYSGQFVDNSSATAPGGYPDLHQTAAQVGTYDDLGAIEYTGNYPTYPTLTLPTPGDVSVTTVSGVSRSRIVNAGGI